MKAIISAITQDVDLAHTAESGAPLINVREVVARGIFYFDDGSEMPFKSPLLPDEYEALKSLENRILERLRRETKEKL